MSDRFTQGPQIYHASQSRDFERLQDFVVVVVDDFDGDLAYIWFWIPYFLL